MRPLTVQPGEQGTGVPHEDIAGQIPQDVPAQPLLASRGAGHLKPTRNDGMDTSIRQEVSD